MKHQKLIHVSFHCKNSKKKWMKIQSLSSPSSLILSETPTSLSLDESMRHFADAAKWPDLIYSVCIAPDLTVPSNAA